jgi:hypothetical protein
MITEEDMWAMTGNTRGQLDGAAELGVPLDRDPVVANAWLCVAAIL